MNALAALTIERTDLALPAADIEGPRMHWNGPRRGLPLGLFC
jgi:hypothetical protein